MFMTCCYLVECQIVCVYVDNLEDSNQVISFGDLGETELLVIFFIIFFCIFKIFKLSVIKIYVNTISHNLNSSLLPYIRLPDPQTDLTWGLGKE